MVTEGVEGLRELVGQHLGYSDWLDITQDRVDQFAAATGDRQWIHVDPVRAASSRYRGPIAHGHLILSLTSHLLRQILDTQGFSMLVNLGGDRVRFLSPVPVGARLRAGAVIRSVDEIRGGARLSVRVVFTIQGQAAPVCVAQVILCAYL
jgi:acyl dehydratase